MSLPATRLPAPSVRFLDAGPRAGLSRLEWRADPWWGEQAERTVETHLLEPIEDEPPRRMEVCFYRRLRDEKTFESAEGLKRQILADVAAAKRFFHLRTAVG